MGPANALSFHCWCTALVFGSAAMGLALITQHPATEREELVYGLVVDAE
jgi:hypothetical protein